MKKERTAINTSWAHPQLLLEILWRRSPCLSGPTQSIQGKVRGDKVLLHYESLLQKVKGSDYLVGSQGYLKAVAISLSMRRYPLTCGAGFPTCTRLWASRLTWPRSHMLKASCKWHYSFSSSSMMYKKRKRGCQTKHQRTWIFFPSCYQPAGPWIGHLPPRFSPIMLSVVV